MLQTTEIIIISKSALCQYSKAFKMFCYPTMVVLSCHYGVEDIW